MERQYCGVVGEVLVCFSSILAPHLATENLVFLSSTPETLRAHVRLLAILNPKEFHMLGRSLDNQLILFVDE